jgi:hypothetical protein
MADALLLAAAFACTLYGMGSFALALQFHWTQVCGPSAPARRAVRRLRIRGGVYLAGALALCLAADHVSMAALVWVMMLSVSAVSLAFVLAYRPSALRFVLALGGRPQAH